MVSITDISNDKDTSLLDSGGRKSILFFWADRHEPSNVGGPFDMVLKTLAEQNNDGGSNVQFYKVLAEEAPKLSRKVSSILMCIHIMSKMFENYIYLFKLLTCFVFLTYHYSTT